MNELFDERDICCVIFLWRIPEHTHDPEKQVLHSTRITGNIMHRLKNVVELLPCPYTHPQVFLHK
jgi:hypothetical protein